MKKIWKWIGNNATQLSILLVFVSGAWTIYKHPSAQDPGELVEQPSAERDRFAEFKQLMQQRLEALLGVCRT